MKSVLGKAFGRQLKSSPYWSDSVDASVTIFPPQLRMRLVEVRSKLTNMVLTNDDFRGVGGRVEIDDGLWRGKGEISVRKAEGSDVCVLPKRK